MEDAAQTPKFVQSEKKVNTNKNVDRRDSDIKRDICGRAWNLLRHYLIGIKDWH